MTDDFLAQLRCPIDPARDATLAHDGPSALVCSTCNVRFPVRNGLPVLIPDEGVLPPHWAEMDRSRLPCVRAAAKK